MKNAKPIPNTLADARRLVARHHWRFLLPALVIPVVVLTAALLLPRRYEAQSIFERRSDLVLTEMAGRGGSQSYTRLRQALSQELGGLPAIERLVDARELAGPLPATASESQRRTWETRRSDLIHQIHRNLRVHFEISTAEVDRVRVTLVDSDPYRASLVVNGLVEDYLERTRRQVDQMLQQAAAFFASQVDTHVLEIEQLERGKLEFEIAHGELLPSESGEPQKLATRTEQRQMLLRQRLQSAETRLRGIEEKLAGIDDQAPSRVVKQPNPALTRLEEQKRDYLAQIERAVVIQKMTDRHPNVAAMQQKIREIEQEMASLPKEVISERVYGDAAGKAQLELALLQVSSEREALAEELRVVNEQVERLRAQGTDALPVRAEYRRLEREVESAQHRQKFWQDNLQRVRVALAAEMGDRGMTLAIIRPAEVLHRPSSPNFAQVLFAALVLGLGGGCGWVVLAERGRQTLDGPEEAEALLNVPVYGPVGEIVSVPGRFGRVLGWGLGYPAILLVLLGALLVSGYLNYSSLMQPRVAMNASDAFRHAMSLAGLSKGGEE